MASMLGLDPANVRVVLDLAAGLWCKADERVVAGMDDQSGDADMLEDSGSCGAEVVVVCGLEAE